MVRRVIAKQRAVMTLCLILLGFAALPHLRESALAEPSEEDTYQALWQELQESTAAEAPANAPSAPAAPAAAATTLAPTVQGITLSPIPGLPAELEVSLSGREPIEFARALLLLDGELLAVPLQRAGPQHRYRVRFPSPAVSLSFRIQAVYSDKRAALSPRAEIPVTCRDSAPAFLDEEESFPGQGELLRHVVEAGERTRVLDTLVETLREKLTTPSEDS
ncbi:MAG: hypothetical protein KDD44_06075 [Bdellovibrionales bacterium]|nr:hypothetical protein [Bdellovibrionales bacterium]